MMKFVILRVAQIDENRKKKTVLVEWDEKKIFSRLLNNFQKRQKQIHDPIDVLIESWVDTILDFKQETLTIP